jgi:SpoVK/Ycf46/Vps4 family AAA+-type ATPase
VVPLELSKDIQVIDYPLPTVEQLEQRFLSRVSEMQRRYGEECIRLDDSARKRLMRALCGLTYEEAENVLAKSLANNGILQEDDVAEALAEKRQIIQKDGILEYFDSDKDFDQVGGLELLRDWLDQRKMAFAGHVVTYEGQEIPLPVPKGILLIGVPGGGKSLVAKAVARAWGLPLLRLDIGRIFGGIVGQSEENMRRAIRVAESVAPTVVWLDEVEKAFPKVSGTQDSGVSLRVMNTYLTWMQEKKAPVFVVSTGNDISQVPPELTRKGRFDEIFYVGLPDQEARQKIFEIHTRGLPLSAEDHASLAAKSRWFTGAEIEQIVKNALYILPQFLASNAPAPEVDEPDDPLVRAIAACMKNFVPLARRKGKDGRGLVAETLAQARMIATPASKNFEKLPEEEETGESYKEWGSDIRF